MKSSFALFAASAASFAWRNPSVEAADMNPGGVVADAGPSSKDADLFLHEWLSAAKAPQLAAIAANQSSPEHRFTFVGSRLSSIPATQADSNKNIKSKVSGGAGSVRGRGFRGRFLLISEGITKRRVCCEVDMIRPESSMGVGMD